MKVLIQSLRSIKLCAYGSHKLVESDRTRTAKCEILNEKLFIFPIDFEKILQVAFPIWYISSNFIACHSDVVTLGLKINIQLNSTIT